MITHGFDIAHQWPIGIMTFDLILPNNKLIHHDVQKTFPKFWHFILLIDQLPEFR